MNCKLCAKKYMMWILYSNKTIKLKKKGKNQGLKGNQDESEWEHGVLSVSVGEVCPHCRTVPTYVPTHTSSRLCVCWGQRSEGGREVELQVGDPLY